MKRMVNRVLARLAMFLIAIILGAIAVAQAQKGYEESRLAKSNAAPPASTPRAASDQRAEFLPIPVAEPSAASANQYTTDLAPPARDRDAQADFAPPPPMSDNQYAADDFGGEDRGRDQQFSATQFANQTTYPQDTYKSPANNRVQVQAVAAEFDDQAATSGNDFADAALTLPPAQEPVEMELPPITAPSEMNSASRSAPSQFVPPMSAPPAQFAPEEEDPYGGNSFNEYVPPTNSSRPVQQDENEQPYYQGSGTVSMPPQTSDQATQSRQSAVAAPNNSMPRMPAGNLASLPSQTNLAYNGVTTGKPGPPELEGPQTPTLTVTKKSPREVQVGKAAKFHVIVRNTGQVPAHEVVIRDEIPHGTQLIDTNPPARAGADGAILWEMGTLRPGAETTVMMELMPVEEGDIGSIATVTFEAAASARTLVTRPQLTLEHTTSRQVLVGEEVIFNIKISNPGTGAATNVFIEENVPAGLQHFNGSELEYQIGTVRPGETRMLELTLKADKPGMVQNVLHARADGNVDVEDICELEVVAPELRVEISGPRRRFLERRANYEIHVANPGTAAAHNVELVAHLPRALKFVNANNSGNYDPQRHVVVWNLAELPAQEMGTVQIETKPVQIGEHAIQIDARASMGLVDSVEHQVSIDGLAALLYTVTDVSDPIEVGGQTTYEVHIVNQGSKTATNLQLGALIPAGMEAINGDGPTRATINGSQIVFESLPRLEPQADTSYSIHVKGITPGDKRIQIQLVSDDFQEPVTKEESTHVYADE